MKDGTCGRADCTDMPGTPMPEFCCEPCPMPMHCELFAIAGSEQSGVLEPFWVGS